MAVTIEITENVTQLFSTESNTVEVIVDNTAIPTQSVNGVNVVIEPHGTVTATTVQGAIEQLADQDFRTTDTPTGSNIEEGDTWYDTDDNQLKVYRETSPGIFEWVPIIVGNISEDSDTLDAGAF